jgi:DNA sulfur modification protein DndC
LRGFSFFAPGRLLPTGFGVYLQEKTMLVDERTIQLFRVEELVFSIEERIEKALDAIVALFMQQVPVVIGYSCGKDSGIVSALTLHAALLAKERGATPFVLITTGATLVENPEIDIHYVSELAKMRKFGQRHGLNIQTAVAKPNLLSTFQMKILTGRGLPSFANVSSDCTSDLKIFPQIRLRKKLFKALIEQGMSEPVTLLGTRMVDESVRRTLNMKARQDRPDVPVRNKDGDLVMTPLRDWSTDDVWEAIALYGSNVYPTYSDFQETTRIYSHAAGTSCAVVADAIYEGSSKKRQGKCGARTGCWSCLATEDKSLANMIEYDERYEYARGLNRLNRFLRNTQYDWSLRNWVGRTIKAGYIAIECDTYSPKMIRMLTRFILQLDYDEEQRARRAGEKPKFQILPLDMMVAVDAYQSLQGLARPFACWADYEAIRSGRVRYNIPEVDRVPETPMPDTRFLFVGRDWEETSGGSAWTGLRDPLLEDLTDGSGCELGLVTLKNGQIVWEAPINPEFSVDMESVCMIEDFELDRLLAMNESHFVPGGITAAYKWYFSYGCLNLSKGMLRKHDEICRRTAFKDRLGLTLEYDLDALLMQSVPFVDLPDHARSAWEHKATIASVQSELELELVC